jgi:hypothetical protein
MNGSDWLDDVARRVCERVSNVDVSHPDDKTLGLSSGLRTVVIHVDGAQAWLAPSFAAGGTLGSRLKHRVQHLDIQQYSVVEATVEAAVDAVSSHLCA